MSHKMAVRLVIAFALIVAWMAPSIIGMLSAPATWLTAGTVLLALGFIWLTLHYRERMLRLRAEWLVQADFTKVPSWARREIWACPRCALPCYSWELVKLHQDPDTSPCAAMMQRALAAEAAPVPGASAVYVPEVATGGLDSFRDDEKADDEKAGEAA